MPKLLAKIAKWHYDMKCIDSRKTLTGAFWQAFLTGAFGELSLPGSSDVKPDKACVLPTSVRIVGGSEEFKSVVAQNRAVDDGWLSQAHKCSASGWLKLLTAWGGRDIKSQGCA